MQAKIKPSFDLRLHLILGLISSFAILFYKTELSFSLALCIGVIFLLIQKNYKKAIKILMASIILLLLSNFMVGKSGVHTFFHFSNMFRHLLIPIAFLSGITDKSTGTILEAFHRLKLPKSFGISTIVFFRFIPTIRYELKTIRNSLKFRRVGTSILDTLCHIPKNFNLTLIPLLMRTMRISDEITVAALVRGVDLENDIISYEKLRWKTIDSIMLFLFGISLIALGIFEIWRWRF